MPPNVAPAGAAPIALLTVEVRREHDVVLARQRARQLAELLGFDAHDQTRLATAVSELARNAYEYGGGGRVRFAVEAADARAGGGTRSAYSARPARGEARQSLVVQVCDDGPGIADVQAVLDGRYVSSTGMGLGLVGARRLADRFDVRTAPGQGTTVEIARVLPQGASHVTPADAARLADALARQAPRGPLDEVQRQNQELLQALDALQTRQAEVERLNVELAETNRGVLALYAELDDRARELARASEYKSRFLSDVSHELRTPLTSVLNMTRFLLDRADGDLTPEQERQVDIIRKSVELLTDMVSDLLDIAKIESGRATLHPSTFTAAELFTALRGMCRPLLTGDAVALTFEAPNHLPPLRTDEQRVTQVLRNFISNAVKFTERGEIAVTAALDPDEPARVRLAVRDTGIGIAPEDQERIFQDFQQVDGPMQRRVRGTGLGLPLTRKLAALLGGRIALASEPGVGSTFTLVVPRTLPTDSDSAADHA